MPRIFALLAVAVTLACALPAALSRADEAAGRQLAQLFVDSFEFELKEDPLFATSYGDRRYNDKLPSVGLADQQRRLAQERSFLERWKSIDRAKLSRAEQINYDIFGRLAQDRIAEGDFHTYLMPITNRNGFHISFPELPKEVPLKTVKDYEDYIARLRAFAAYTDQHIELLREGVKQGFTLPGVVLRDYDKPIVAHIVDDPTRSLLYQPFTAFPPAIGPADRERLATAAKQAIATSVVPAYRKLLEFMTKEYVPAAREQVGCAVLPRGRELYRHRVRHFTTLDVTPQAIHETGLAEVKRIRAEMDAVIKRSGFTGDFAAFVAFLRTDPRFYVDTPAQLLKETGLVLKRIDGELPRLFKTLPRTPLRHSRDPTVHCAGHDHGLLLAAAGRSLAGWLLLRQYVQLEEPAAV